MHDKPGVHTWGNLKSRRLSIIALALEDFENLSKQTEIGSTI
jgi:hypothetical protein